LSVSNILFKNRSYTPIPFVICMVAFAKPNMYTVAIGITIAVLGELFRFWGVSYIGSESRTTENVGGTKLMVAGPYAYTRNPLYIGNLLIYTGIGVISNSLFPYLIIVAILFFIFQYIMIIKDEEEYLLSTFKISYMEYCKKVNRFIPGFKPFRSSEGHNFKFDFKAGLRSERRTLQSFTIVISILMFIWIYRIYG
jgi:protein-S-isoprenylcysteine O-methyltransferase Ste14